MRRRPLTLSLSRPLKPPEIRGTPRLAPNPSRFGLTACVFALLAFPAVGDAAPAVPFKGDYPETSRARLYPASEVRVGQTGVGFTVFRGSEVQPFGVEILGIMRGMLGPHRDVLLARLSGPEIEHTGVISGMSGSPVYIDGRLLGAVSYRFGAFSKEPIAGITPIESMLEIYGSKDVPPPPTARRSGGTTSGVVLPSSTRSRERIDLLPFPNPRPEPLGHQARPIDTPLTLVGFTPFARSLIEPVLENSGLVLVAGGAGSTTRDPDSPSPRRTGKVAANLPSVAGGVKAAPIAPGAPIAAILMRGDLHAAATGTVTFLDGLRVFGFGHPFMGQGHSAFPMASAAILHTLATPIGSYKQSATALEVGAIVHDRLTAIAGDLGVMVPMVPIRVVVGNRGARPGTLLTTEVEVVDDESWLPSLLQSVIVSASTGRLGFESGGTVDFEARIRVGALTVGLTDTYSTSAPMPVGALAARDIAGVAALITGSHFDGGKIRSVEVELSYDREPDYAFIEAVRSERPFVRPGERAPLLVRVRPYRGPVRELRIEAPVPPDASGDLTVVVGGALELDQREEKVYGQRVPNSLTDLLGLLSECRPGRGLYGRVIHPRPGMRTDIELWPSLPLSARAKLQPDNDVRQASITEALGPAFRLEDHAVMLGSYTLTIPVRKRESADQSP